MEPHLEPGRDEPEPSHLQKHALLAKLVWAATMSIRAEGARCEFKDRGDLLQQELPRPMSSLLPLISASLFLSTPPNPSVVGFSVGVQFVAVRI